MLVEQWLSVCIIGAVRHNTDGFFLDFLNFVSIAGSYAVVYKCAVC